MAATRPRSKDLGAALAGLVLGGSVLFLVMLTIVWLTNRHFEGLKASGAHGPPAAGAHAPTSPPAVPSTTGTGTQAPAAPSAAPAGH
jgi:hypothetical protein